MAVENHLEMHGDHRACLAEDALWRDQAAIWHAELEQMVAELPQIESALRDHESALQAHTETIGRYEQTLASHEHALAEHERGTTVPELVEMSRSHQRELQVREQHRAAHERLRRHHYAFVAKWNLLKQALGEAL